MKNIRTALTLCLLFSITSVFSQNYVFKVLANKGSNEIKTDGKWKRLLTGATLHKGDELKVSENAYIGLVHSGGHAMELVKSGNYTVAEIEATVPKLSSATAKYAEFLASKMEDKGRTSGAVGGVHRGGSGQYGIRLIAPDDVSVYNQEALIRWEALEGDNITYRVKVTDMYDETVMEEQTSDPMFKLDLNDPSIASSIVVFVDVSSYGEQKAVSNQISIKKLTDSQKAVLVNELVPLMKELNNETAVAKYILAGFFEENGLILDAIKHYESAIRLAPEVKSYKDAYEYFLLRNGLRKKTED